MPAPTQVPDDEKYKVKNPGDTEYNRKFNEGNFEARAANTPSQDEVERGLREAENAANTPREGADTSIRDQEESSGSDSNWGSNYTGARQRKTQGRFRVTWTRGLIGGGALAGIAAIIAFITTLAPAALLANLSSNATVNLDTQSSIMDRRVLRVLDGKLNGSEVTNGSCDVIKVACRFSRPSNALLTTLDEFGIKPVNASGDAIEKTRIGFPNERPVRYELTKRDGSVLQVSPREFISTLRTDPEFRQAFTRAYNARYLAFTDVKIRNAFFKKYGVDRKGEASKAIANAESPRDAVREIAVGADKDNPVRNSSPEGRAAAARELVEEEALKELQKSARKGLRAGGSPTLTIGTIACLGINAPGFIGNIVRIYQMRQLIVLASTIVLTPESMTRAGDMDPELMASIGTMLTATSISNGTTSKSAMDSLGIRNVLFSDTNKSSSTMYQKFIPGGAISAQFGGINGFANSPGVKSTCDAVNSPQAAVSAAAIDGAIGAATGGVGAIVIGLLRGATAAVVAIATVDALIQATTPLMQGVISGVLGLISDQAIADILGSQDIENASEEGLGDALGSGLNYFFSQSTLTTGGAPLTTSQVSNFNAMHTDSIIAYAEQDRLGRSAFDVSSPYTFLGSIFSRYAREGYVANNILQTVTSSIASTLRQPFNLLSRETYAATDAMAEKCGFAADHGVDPTVAIGLYGEICAGIPAEYMNVSSSELVNSLVDQIDENTGIPKPDSNIATVQSDCSDGSLLTAQGCTINDQERADLSIYQYDFRINNIFDNTENVEEEAAAGAQPQPGTGTNTGRPPEAVDKNKGWSLAPNTGVNVSQYQCDPRTEDRGLFTSSRYGYTMRLCLVSFNTNVNDNNNGSKMVNALISTNLMNMFEAARADGVELGIADAMRLDGGSRSYYSEHATGLAVDLKTATTGTICFNGNSASGYGSKAAAEAACSRVGGKMYEAYSWLNRNAANFGFHNFDPEPWHWSTSGS
jgi:hypothetical protein